MDMTKDSNGKRSSKRIAGFIAGGVGLLLLSAIGVCSFFFRLADPGTAFNAGLTLISVGGTLLGIGTFETKKNNSGGIK